MSDLRTIKAQSTFGILLIATASLTVPIVDGIAKLLAETYSPLLIAWARYAVATLIVLPVAFSKMGRSLFPRTALLLQVLRTICLVVAMTLFFFSLQSTPLVTAIAAYFIGPIVGMILSIFFLNEEPSLVKITCTLLSIAGMLIILNPLEDASLGVGLALIPTAFNSDLLEPIFSYLLNG
ncbi:DMT family transporter [Cohaesibacter sp. ES.047]|uniref:DMT family transporter n=1 Tax=Cohaesibacter sp. ES.047 TaxID=1798205 RepID=UPI000BB87B7A|nr:DMT family transporter [Cohaesibacter sp. ES.047]